MKRLEEERERSLKDDQNEDGKKDLEKNLVEERSENDRDDGDGTPEEASPEKNAGEGSDREFNVSNSTGNRGGEPEPVQTVNVKPDPVSSESKPTDEDSYNDSQIRRRRRVKRDVENRSRVGRKKEVTRPSYGTPRVSRRKG